MTVKGNLSKGDVMSFAKDKMEHDKAEFIQGLKDMASRQSEGGNKSDSSEKIISSCSKTEPSRGVNEEQGSIYSASIGEGVSSTPQEAKLSEQIISKVLP